MDKFTKNDIGKTFYAVPEGNNVAQYKDADNGPREIQLMDMRRTKGEFCFSDSQWKNPVGFSVSERDAGDLCFHVRQFVNSGYLIFRSMDDYATYIQYKKAKGHIIDFYRYGKQQNPISSKDVIEAAKLLGWKDEVSAKDIDKLL